MIHRENAIGSQRRGGEGNRLGFTGSQRKISGVLPEFRLGIESVRAIGLLGDGGCQITEKLPDAEPVVLFSARTSNSQSPILRISGDFRWLSSCGRLGRHRQLNAVDDQPGRENRRRHARKTGVINRVARCGKPHAPLPAQTFRRPKSP